LLRQVYGVGVLIALTFILTIDDRSRFPRSRDVGCYLGMRPRRRQSGGSNPELGITKEGDSYLRKLLVQGAHVILGRHGTDSDLRRWGQKLAARGQGGQEEGAHGGGAEAGDSAAPPVGHRRGIRAVAGEPEPGGAAGGSLKTQGRGEAKPEGG